MKCIPVVLSVLVLFSGCRNIPGGNAGEWMDSSVEMSDSGAVYDMWLMVRVQAGAHPDSLGIGIRITSPDGKLSASDSFVMPADRASIDSLKDERLRYVSSELSYDIESLYRTGIHPLQYGRWVVSCRSDDRSVTGVRVRVEKRTME